jgi:hypothetical protein
MTFYKLSEFNTCTLISLNPLCIASTYENRNVKNIIAKYIPPTPYLCSHSMKKHTQTSLTYFYYPIF